jgi:hypothetical protein
MNDKKSCSLSGFNETVLPSRGLTQQTGRSMKRINELFALSTCVVLYSSHAWAKCTVNGEEIPCEQFWRQYGWIFGVIGLVLLVVLGFWIWMLVDCLKSEREDKLVWTLVLLFGNIIGAILYFLIARNKGVKGARQ